MNYKISQPLAIFEYGKRDNQEDALFPAFNEATDANRTFVVCDGMGGHEKGEVASNAVCRAFADNLHKLDKFNPDRLAELINDAYDALDAADEGGAKKKMGTTFTFLHLHAHGATVAHIGDSRVYFISPSRNYIWHTRDHSLVQSFLEANLIKASEVKTHPQRNILTRVMQPHETRSEAVIDTISNIIPGDYFLLCSDGLIEDFDDKDILRIFSDKSKSDEQKRDFIIHLTKNNSDNHTAYIIRIEEFDKKKGDWKFTSDNEIFEINEPVVIPELNEAECNDSDSQQKKTNWFSRLFKR